MDLQNQDSHEILNDLLQTFHSVCQNDSVLTHQQGDTGHTSTTAMKNPRSQDPFLNGQETASTLAPQILIIPPLSASDIDMNKPPDLDIQMSTQDYSIHRDSHVGTTSSSFFPVVSSVNDLFPSVTLGSIISSTGIEFNGNSIVASTVVDSFISSPTPTTCTASTFGNTSKTHELSDVTSCAEPLHIHVDKPSSMLEKLLTGNHGISDANMTGSNSSASVSSPDAQVNSPSPVSSSNNSPFTNFDTNTQSTMIEKAERLHLDSDSFIGTIDDISSDILIGWNEMSSMNSVAPKSAKVQKCDENMDAPTALLSQQPSVEKVFDVGEAVSSSEFIFAKFGAEHVSDNLFKFGHNRTTGSTGSATSPRVGLDFVNEQPVEPPQSRSRANHTAMSSRASSQRRATKEPILNQQFPSRVCSYELRMLDQPEEQHRARYLTEGSRGAVKNRSQQGNPVVKLFGHNESAVVQIFVGNDTGKTRPHGFYQACKVCGKNSTPCTDKDIDGTTVIEVELKPSNDMTAIIDCVGILKLRNADVEQRIGIAKAKKKSTKARLIFRTTFQKPDGSSITLQVASSTILCTQPAGQPEICKMSIRETLMSGGDELFIIGKNFLKGAKVMFQQPRDGEDGGFKWEEEGEIDKDYFQPTHIICKVPPYSEPILTGPVVVQVVVSSGGKVSDPQPFTYKPEVTVKQEMPMETDQQGGVKRNFSFVAPEALELNQQIQNSQNSDAMFQLPPGSIAAISRIDSPPTPMDESHVHSHHSRKSSFSSQVQSNDSPDHEYFNPPSHEHPSPASSTDIPHNSQTPLPSPFHSPQSIVNSPKDGMSDQHGIQQCLMQAMTNGGQQSVQLQQHQEQIQHVQHFQQQHVQQQQQHMQQHMQHHMNTQQHIHQQAQMQQQQFQNHVEQLQQQQEQQQLQQHQPIQMPGYQMGSSLVQIQPTVASPPFHQQQQQQQAQQSGVGLLQQYNGLVPGSLQDANNSMGNIQNSFNGAMFNGQPHANPSIIPKHETTGSSVLSAVTMASLASNSGGPQIIICPAGSTGLPGTVPNSMPAPPSIVIMPGSGPNSNTTVESLLRTILGNLTQPQQPQQPQQQQQQQRQ